jgi:flagellar basal body-associated protein FliL
MILLLIVLVCAVGLGCIITYAMTSDHYEHKIAAMKKAQDHLPKEESYKRRGL